MGSVATDLVGGHDDAENDSEGAEDEEADGEGDLLDGGAVVDDVGAVHRDALVRDREGPVDVRHCRPQTSSIDRSMAQRRDQKRSWEERGVM